MENDVETINFFDQDANDSDFISIKKMKDTIRLSISLEHDGDIDVFIDLATAKILQNSLEKMLME